MLSTLKAKVKGMLIKKGLLLTAIFYMFSTEIIASEQNFQLHGFISQGLIDVSGSNFVNDDGSLSAELTELGLNGSYQLNSSLMVAIDTQKECVLITHYLTGLFMTTTTGKQMSI